MEQKLNKSVFLSYAYKDKDAVKKFHDALSKSGFKIFSDYTQVPPGEPWGESIQYAFESSDFIVVFLTESLFERRGMHFDYSNDFLDYVKMRNVNLIPVRLDHVKVPPYFMEFEVLDLSGINNDAGLLLQKIKSISDINFGMLSTVQFEELIYSLLQNLDFQNIQWNNRQVKDDGFDFIAEYYNTNPFGLREKEVWLIECKYYKENRFDLRTIQKIINDYKYVRRKDAKLVLITNSQFNSVAIEYIGEIQRTDFIDIKLIDGFQLKIMLSRFPRLIDKFFKS